MDANDFDAHHAIITRAMESLGGIDLALIAHGTPQQPGSLRRVC